MLCLFSVNDNLFLRLKHGNFRGLHNTATDVLKAELILHVGIPGPDNRANQFFNLWNEPNQNSRVDDVEAGVESRQGKGKQCAVLL